MTAGLIKCIRIMLEESEHQACFLPGRGAKQAGLPGKPAERSYMEAAAVTDRGLVRTRNEDSYFIDEQRALFILCDGMGGHKAGNIASQLAVEVINREYQVQNESQIHASLNQAVQMANLEIWEAGNRNLEFRDMGTTAVVAVLYQLNGQFKITIANVGDSRLYLIRGGQIRQVTVDHTVAEQMHIQGIISREEAIRSPYSHVLTRALGTHSVTQPDLFEEDLQEGDLIVMCSDGLSDMLMETEILDISQRESDIDRMSRLYLQTALERGGHDNITVIIIGV